MHGLQQCFLSPKKFVCFSTKKKWKFVDFLSSVNSIISTFFGKKVGNFYVNFNINNITIIRLWSPSVYRRFFSRLLATPQTSSWMDSSMIPLEGWICAMVMKIKRGNLNCKLPLYGMELEDQMSILSIVSELSIAWNNQYIVSQSTTP